jgi:hypothetical protein
LRIAATALWLNLVACGDISDIVERINMASYNSKILFFASAYKFEFTCSTKGDSSPKVKIHRLKKSPAISLNF